MAKILTGVVTSVAMEKTIVVEVTRHVPHPLYRKLMKRSKKHKVDNSGDVVVKVGQTVKIVETRSISKDKHFKLLETMKKVSTSHVAEAKEEKISEVSKGQTKTTKRVVKKKEEKK